MQLEPSVVSLDFFASSFGLFKVGFRSRESSFVFQ
jgi:hypothetical protein